MLLKVGHEELQNVSDEIKVDSEAYDVEIENMLKEVEKLKTIWQGQDAETFCDSFSQYLNKMKNMSVAMKNMSTVMDIANNGYQDMDAAFSNALKTEASNYDE